MSVSPHIVLVTTCELDDDEADPTTAGTVATEMGRTPAAVRPVLRTLCRSAFLAETKAGYRPTATARELLARGIHLDEVAAVDVLKEE